MAQITYTDKDKTKPKTDVRRKFHDYDANEVKASVNAIYDFLSVGLFAALTEATRTEIYEVGTYVYINGIFSNSPNVGFEFVSDPEPAIKYTGDTPFYFKIDASATVSSNKNSTELRCAIKKNGTLVNESIMTAFLKNNGEKYNLSGTSVVYLEKDDTIQMVTTCTSEAQNIMFYNLTATIFPFIIP